jgi:hypothetical protein
MPCVCNNMATFFMAPQRKSEVSIMDRVHSTLIRLAIAPSGVSRLKSLRVEFLQPRLSLRRNTALCNYVEKGQHILLPIGCLWFHLGMLYVQPQTSESYVVWQAKHLHLPVAGVLRNYAQPLRIFRLCTLRSISSHPYFGREVSVSDS